MATRSIVTYQPDIECDVCGRRLLRGERPDIFLAAGGERTVCELCMPRAAQEGWRRASEVSPASIGGERPRRGISLIGRLRQLRAGESRRRVLEGEEGEVPVGGLLYDREEGLDGGPIEGIGVASEAVQAAGAVLGGMQEPSSPPGFGAERPPAWPASAGGGGADPAESEIELERQGDPVAEPTLAHRIAADHDLERRQQTGAVPASVAGGRQERPLELEQPTEGHVLEAASLAPAPDASERLQVAVEIFNASEYSQRVAGIARSLGEPSVTVRPADDGSGMVAILVAWELAWYRYGVDPAAPEMVVALLADGTELHELPEEDRTANAVASDRGEVSLLL